MRFARPMLGLFAAAAAALTATAALTAPASAAHPERPPQSFDAEQLGEDLCTAFQTSGEVAFPAHHPPEEPSAVFRGDTAVTAAGGSPCVPRENYPRRVEFTAYVADGLPVASNTVPVEPAGGYEFSLVSPSGIDYVTVAVCIDLDAPPVEERCGGTVVIDEDGTPDAEPSYCVYRYVIANGWGDGYQAEVELTPLVEDGLGWEVIIRQLDGVAIHAVWNADVTVLGDTAYFHPPGWSGVIPVGASYTFGFIGSGDPPSDIEVYINGRPCDPIA